MIWANFLHFYQPPTQKPFWIHKITAESYRKILKGLIDSSEAKLTLNINGILLELLDEYGEDDIISTIKTLLERGQLELTGSAKYHPILPFLPDEEIIRQIKLNEETHQKYFGDLYKPKGFFPPEMGFTKHVAEIVAGLGYEWIIADELSFPRDKKSGLNYSKIYTINGLDDFKIYFRERRMSWIILSGQVGTGNLLIQGLGNRLHKNEYLLTAMDGETFGHHRPGLDHLLFEIYNSSELKTALISELPAMFKNRESVEPLPSTWALMEKDLELRKPFSRWRDEENVIHKMQWELSDLAIKTIHNAANKKTVSYEDARRALDRALHSDQYWWASAKPWWSIEMIERGAKEFLNAISMTPGASETDKRQAKELYKNILFTAFDWQREGVVDALARSEDEEIRQRTDVGLPRLPKKEIDKIITNLKKEIKTLVQDEEYERAAQLRDRIKELERYSTETEKARFSKEGSEEW